jgi:hypothetical protein
MREEKYLPNKTLVFATFNGIDELSTKNTIAVSNGIVGSRVVLSNGSITWTSIPVIASYIYVYDPDDGTGIAHYASSGDIFYKNGEVDVEAHPITITPTGITGVTGIITRLEVYNATITVDDILVDYANELRFW